MNGYQEDMQIACISKVRQLALFAIANAQQTLEQAILTVAISRKLFQTHKRRSEFTLSINQVRKLAISKDGHQAEIRAYSGNPDVRTFPCFLARVRVVSVVAAAACLPATTPVHPHMV